MKIGPALRPTMATNAARPSERIKRIAASGNLANQGRVERAQPTVKPTSRVPTLVPSVMRNPSQRNHDRGARQTPMSDCDTQNGEIAVFVRINFPANDR